MCMHESSRDSVMRQRAISQLVCSSSCKGHYMYINTNAWACNTIRCKENAGNHKHMLRSKTCEPSFFFFRLFPQDMGIFKYSFQLSIIRHQGKKNIFKHYSIKLQKYNYKSASPDSFVL